MYFLVYKILENSKIVLIDYFLEEMYNLIVCKGHAVIFKQRR